MPTMQVLYQNSFLEAPAPQRDAVAYTKRVVQILPQLRPRMIDDTTLYFPAFSSQNLQLLDLDTNLTSEIIDIPPQSFLL